MLQSRSSHRAAEAAVSLWRVCLRFTLQQSPGQCGQSQSGSVSLSRPRFYRQTGFSNGKCFLPLSIETHNTKRSNRRLLDALVSEIIDSVLTRNSEPLLSTVSLSQAIVTDDFEVIEMRTKKEIFHFVRSLVVLDFVAFILTLKATARL